MSAPLRFNEWGRIEAIIRQYARDDHFMCAPRIAEALEASGFLIIRKSDLKHETEQRRCEAQAIKVSCAVQDAEKCIDEAAADFKARWLKENADVEVDPASITVETARDHLVSRVVEKIFANV